MLRLFATIVYITIDVLYVYLSKTIYERAVKSISNVGFPPGRMAAIVMAWMSMGVGWYFLAVPMALSLTPKYGAPLSGAFAGFVYGIAVIGTFNFTQSAMFKKWCGGIMLRDLIWGVGWSTLSVMFYTMLSFRYQRLDA